MDRVENTSGVYLIVLNSYLPSLVDSDDNGQSGEYKWRISNSFEFLPSEFGR